MTSVILDRRATMHEMRGLVLSTTGAVDVAVAFAWVQPLADTSHEQRLFGFLLDGARDTLAVLRSKHEGA
jgi:hypothetical protein